MLPPNFFRNLSCCIGLLSVTSVSAQTPTVLPVHQALQPYLPKECGVPPMTPDQIRYTLDVVARQIVPRNAGTTCIPIQAHIVRNDDGSGGISIADLTKGLANLNYLCVSRCQYRILLEIRSRLCQQYGLC
jgi:hypothetical protein